MELQFVSKLRLNQNFKVKECCNLCYLSKLAILFLYLEAEMYGACDMFSSRRTVTEVVFSDKVFFIIIEREVIS